LRQDELDKALSLLSNRIGRDEERVVRELSHAIISTVLSIPMNNIRKEVRLGDISEQDILRIVENIFNYDDG
jgi:glutamyl-tRNA reductase